MIPARASCEDAKRCAIYIRVSTAMQRMEGWSLAAQEASLTAFAKSKGWKVVGIYADEGKSARKRLKERKEIFRLLDDVKAGLIDVILFKELDRWFRSVSDFYKIQDVLDEHGVTWVSERQPNLGMTTKEDRLQVNLLLSVGQNETDSTSDRIKYTNKYMREQKRWTSGKSTLPRGHTLDGDQHVIIDPEQEPFVRDLIARVFQIGSLWDALAQVNEEHGQRFLYNNAMNMLRNPMLCGEYKEVPDFIEKPYLTRKEFQHLQTVVKRNARSEVRHFYIFSGLVTCDGCGGGMTGSTTEKRGRLYKYYRCNSANRERHCTSRLRVKEETLEAELMEYVKDAVADRIAHVKKITQDRKTRKPRKSNRATIEKRLKKLKKLYVEDEMTWEEYQTEKATIQAQLVEDEPEEQLPDVADLKKIQSLFDGGVEELYQTFTPEERREFWRGVLRSVTIKDRHVHSVDFIE